MASQEVFLCYSIGVAHNKQSEPHHGKGNAEQHGSQLPPQVPHSPTESNSPPTPNGDTKPHKPDRDWLDYVKFAIETIALGFLIAYTVYAGLQWGEMKRATDSSREIFTVGQRPWLGVDGHPAMAQNERQAWVIKSNTRNFGLSPGLHAVFATHPIFGPFSGKPEEVTVPIEAACAMGENLTLGGNGFSAPTPQGHGYTIFPGNFMENEKQSVGNAENGVIFLGCITYLDEFYKTGNSSVHHTPFCYNVRQPFYIGEEMIPCFSVKPPD